MSTSPPATQLEQAISKLFEILIVQIQACNEDISKRELTNVFKDMIIQKVEQIITPQLETLYQNNPNRP